MILVPIRTGRGQNDRGHWRKKHRSTKNQGEAVAWQLARAAKPQIPCSVLLTRVAPSSGLDDDNLAGSLKAVRDAVAKWLSVDDRHRDQVRYRYAQCRGDWGVRIEFGPPPAHSSAPAAPKPIARQQVTGELGELSSTVPAVVRRSGSVA